MGQSEVRGQNSGQCEKFHLLNQVQTHTSHISEIQTMGASQERGGRENRDVRVKGCREHFPFRGQLVSLVVGSIVLIGS